MLKCNYSLDYVNMFSITETKQQFRSRSGLSLVDAKLLLTPPAVALSDRQQVTLNSLTLPHLSHLTTLF
jgi:hypothetical protein